MKLTPGRKGAKDARKDFNAETRRRRDTKAYFIESSSTDLEFFCTGGIKEKEKEQHSLKADIDENFSLL